jgi:hypothetical protein
MMNVRSLGIFSLVFMLLLMPVGSSLTVPSQLNHQTRRSQDLNTVFSFQQTNQNEELIVYDVRGPSVTQRRYLVREQKLIALYTAIDAIAQKNVTNKEKIQALNTLLDENTRSHLSHRLPIDVYESIRNSKNHSSVYSKQDIRGFFGVLYGSFTSDYEDNGFLCLGYPFPFFNAFPLFFTGFGHGDLYFSGILEDGSYGTSHLRFDEFASLFSLFFFGTVVLFPLAYFGFQGFMFGISFICMGSGR